MSSELRARPNHFHERCLQGPPQDDPQQGMTQCQDEFRILYDKTQKLKVAKWCWIRISAFVSYFVNQSQL